MRGGSRAQGSGVKDKLARAQVHHALPHLLPPELPHCTEGPNGMGQRGQADGDTGTDGARSVWAAERDLSASG